MSERKRGQSSDSNVTHRAKRREPACLLLSAALGLALASPTWNTASAAAEKRAAGDAAERVLLAARLDRADRLQALDDLRTAVDVTSLEISNERRQLDDSTALLARARALEQGRREQVAMRRAARGRTDARIISLEDAIKAAAAALIQHERQPDLVENASASLRAWATALSQELTRAHRELDAIVSETRSAQEALGRAVSATSWLAMAKARHARQLASLTDERQVLLASSADLVPRAYGASAWLARLESASDVLTSLAHEQALGDLADVSEHEGLEVAPVIGSTASKRAYELDSTGSGLAPTLSLPLSGTIVSRFGETTTGPLDRGITIAGMAGATVEAPAAGEVVFAGSFKRFGLLLIIDHGGEYHTLLAGMSSLGAHEGDIVQAGQIVGRLAEGHNNPRLYMEVRLHGIPVNPLPLAAARTDKVRG